MSLPTIKPVPTDAHRRRVVVIVALAVCGVLTLVAGVLYLYLRSGEDVERGPLTLGTIESTQPETRSAGIPTASVDVTIPVESTRTVDPLPGRVARIAFRLGGSIDVANEDGTSATSVARSADGVFALSPDGTHLALVDGTGLRVVRVADGVIVRTESSVSAVARPVWAPDSTRLLFVRTGSGAGVWSAGVAAGAATRLGDGFAASISPDGNTTALVVERGTGEGTLLVRRGAAGFKAFSLTGRPTAVAAADDMVFVGVSDSSGVSRIVKVPNGSSKTVAFAGPPEVDVVAVWGVLSLSPDGSCLVAAATGDDGFSRVRVFETSDASANDLASRRDAYPVGWSADGSSFFHIEGNAVQGESTVLVRTDCPGLSRRLIVTGATF